MKLGMMLLATALVASPAFAQKTQKKPAQIKFDSEVAEVTEKADLCYRTGYRSSEHCDDLLFYEEKLWKGNMTVWMKYNFDKGNLNASNIDDFENMMNAIKKVNTLPMDKTPAASR